MRFIEAYISGRVSREHVDGELSGTVSVRSGVPQGFPIGPLFSPFRERPPDASETMTLLFANDIKMVTSLAQGLNIRNNFIAVWDWS